MLRILKLIVPFKRLAFLNMLFNLIQIVAGLFSLALIMPLLDFMFNNNKDLLERNLNKKQGGFNEFYTDFISWMTQLVQDDKRQALLYISIALIVATVIKNIARYLALFYLVILRNKVIQDIRKRVFNRCCS